MIKNSIHLAQKANKNILASRSSRIAALLIALLVTLGYFMFHFFSTGSPLQAANGNTSSQQEYKSGASNISTEQTIPTKAAATDSATSTNPCTPDNEAANSNIAKDCETYRQNMDAAAKSVAYAQALQAQQDQSAANVKAMIDQQNSQAAAYQAQNARDQQIINSNYQPPLIDCSVFVSQYNPLAQQLAQWQAALVNAPQTAAQAGNYYGMTASGYQTQLNNLISQDNQMINSINGQMNNLKNQYPQC